MDNTMDPLRLENQLCFPLYAASRKIVNLYTPYFKPLGITYTQYIVLMVLWAQDGVSVRELGERLYLDSGTLTPLLKKMESSGLVRRERAKEDERVTMICITPKGDALKESCKEIPFMIGKSCTGLSKEDAMELRRILGQMLCS